MDGCATIGEKGVNGLDDQNLRLHELVRSLGLSRSYAGYKYLVYALELLREEPERLELVTKGIYPEVARRFGVTFGGVDKGLRTAAEVCREGLGETLSVRDFLGVLHRMDCERQGQSP